MANQYTYDDIERYANGEMNPQERQSFEEAIKTDEKLASETKFYQEAAEFIELNGLVEDISQELEAEHFYEEENKEEAEQKEQETPVIPLRPRANRLRILAYAASFALLIFAFPWYANSNYSDAALAYTDKEEVGLSFSYLKGKGNESTAERNLGIAKDALKQKKYVEAIQALNQIPSSNENYNEALSLQAFAHLQQKEYPKAKELALQLSQQTNDSNAAMQGEWLAVKAMLASKDPQLEGLLNTISNNQTHPYHQNAVDLKQQLNSFWRFFVF